MANEEQERAELQRESVGAPCSATQRKGEISMNTKLTTIVVAGVLLVSACGKKPVEVATPAVAAADSIYIGGDIVTVNEAQPSVEALAVKDGRILAVGTRGEIEAAHKGESTKVVDLAGKTLLPGFIDPHSHFIDSLSMAYRVNVSAPPAGPAKSADEIVAELRKSAQARNVKPGELIIGYGYDENLMRGGRLLNRDLLDKAFPANPVIVIHVSMHGAVLNSPGFELYGYKDGMPTPAGGVILRKPGTTKLDGLVMETGYLQVAEHLPSPTQETELAAARAGQMIYASAGITTAQEGATHAPQLAQLQRLAAAGALFIDVVTYPFITGIDEVLAKNPPSSFGTYGNHLKLGGCKITGDGSPQGRTAFFTTPYLRGGPAGERDWVGKPTFPQEFVNASVKKCYDAGLQLLFHANGDAAIDSLLTAHELAAAGSLDKDRRTTVIHAQFIRKDQLARFAQYKIIPSFFTDHTFFFADTHVQNRGKEQTYFISPMHSAYAAGLKPTNHTDYAVAPIDQLLTIWTAVNRISRNGEVIGPDERATPLQALQAITINAAYEYGEEDSKGSLEPGKIADLVILDKNPLKVEPMTIKDITVVETIKDGATIYKAR
jgi:predicted amidohydrolase YtcJ